MSAVANGARALEAMPGPRPLPLLGNLHQLDIPRMHLQLERWTDEFGPIFRIRIGPHTRVCISDIEVINQMLRERPEIYRRPSNTEIVMEEMGFNGVFSQDGEPWRRQRKLVAHALNPAHLSRFYPALRETTTRLLQRWHTAAAAQTEINLCRDLMRYTVDVTARLAFGIDVNTLETDGPVVQQHLDKVFPMLFRRVVAPFPLWRYWRTAADRELDRALAAIRTTVINFTHDCRARMQHTPTLYTAPSNFLEAIIAAQEVEEEEFTDEEIYANVVTLLLAGEDTTANTTAWAMKFLIDHPSLFAAARAEADRVLGADRVPADLETIRELDFIEAFAHETLRFKPVAPMLGIEPKQDVEVLGYRLPAGTTLLALTRVNALDDSHFAAAGRFDPTRWLSPQDPVHQPHHANASIPFGSGPRFCPGRGLALLEIKAVLAMLCRNFDLRLARPDEAVTERLNFTLVPEHLDIRLTSRS